MANDPVDGLIHFVCVDARHTRQRGLGAIGPTIFTARWAFCPGGASSAHRWAPIPGIELGALRRLLERRDPAELVLDAPGGLSAGATP